MPGVLTPPSLLYQQTPGQLAIHGDTVIYTLRRTVGGAERCELWTVSLSGGEPQAVAGGPGWDSTPRFDPDGGRVAFLRSTHDAPAQVHVIDLPGGEPRQVTSFVRGAFDLAWDGDALIVLAEDDGSDRIVCEATLAPEDGPTALRLVTLDWRSDGERDGGLRLHPRHLHRVRLDGGAPQRLTAGPWSASRPRVGPDGGIYYLADPRPDADLAPRPQVYRAGDEQPVTDVAGGVRRFHLTDRGIRVLGKPVAGALESDFPRWFHGDLTASRRGPVDLTPDDGPLGSGEYMTGLLGDETDLHDWSADLDDCAAATTLSREGSTVPVSAVDGRPLIDGPAICGALAAHDGAQPVMHDGADHRGTVVAVLATPEAPGPDLYALDPAGPRRLTHHGSWLDGAPRPRRVEASGPAGPITVFLIEPRDGAGVRGTVIDVHGGPTGQWGVVPPLEALLLAEAGFRVALPNIRGSVDRGPAWVHGLYGAWGEADVADVLAVLDHLIADDLATEGRIGVMGLSYGGFLTQYLIGVTDRFSAAVAENGVANQMTAWALSDAGLDYNRATGLADPLTDDGVERLWQASPLKNAARITTPLLMLQGGADRTCPASDNEQLFVALRAVGRTVDYVLYPDEGHLMQATARIDRRIDRHERVIRHFQQYLTNKET